MLLTVEEYVIKVTVTCSVFNSIFLHYNYKMSLVLKEQIKLGSCVV